MPKRDNLYDKAFQKQRGPNSGKPDDGVSTSEDPNNSAHRDSQTVQQRSLASGSPPQKLTTVPLLAMLDHSKSSPSLRMILQCALSGRFFVHGPPLNSNPEPIIVVSIFPLSPIYPLMDPKNGNPPNSPNFYIGKARGSLGGSIFWIPKATP